MEGRIRQIGGADTTNGGLYTTYVALYTTNAALYTTNAYVVGRLYTTNSYIKDKFEFGALMFRKSSNCVVTFLKHSKLVHLVQELKFEFYWQAVRHRRVELLTF